MKKFIFLFLIFFPFLIYANNTDYSCTDYDNSIVNLLKFPNLDDIYIFLNKNSDKYFNKCGNTENFQIIIDTYYDIVLNKKIEDYYEISGDFEIRLNDNDKYVKLAYNLRRFAFDEKLDNTYYKIIKKYGLYNNIKQLEYSYESDHKFVLSKVVDDIYTEFLTSEAGDNITKYYKIDSSEFCGSDTEGYYGCVYKYIHNEPLKLSGTLTVSNYINSEYNNPNYLKHRFYEGYFFKTSFKANNIDLKFDNIFILPITYNLKTTIPKNNLKNGAVGEIVFDVDFIIDKDSFIKFGKSFILYVKDLNFNSVKEIKYYDKSFMKNVKKDFNSYSYEKLKKYFLYSDDGYINIRDKPNGNIIYTIKLDDENIDDYVYYYEGFSEPNESDYDFGLQYGFPERQYVYNWYKILKYSKSFNKEWYFITFFYKDNDKYKSIHGYIHSSQIKINEKNNIDIEKFINDIGDVDKLSYDELFNILCKFPSSSHLPYVENNKLQLLINRYISFLLSDEYFIRDDEDICLINNFYNYIDDEIYYKLLDKYQKDIVKYNVAYNKAKIESLNKVLNEKFSNKFASYFKYIPYKNYTVNRINRDKPSQYFNLVVSNAEYSFKLANPIKISGKIIVSPDNYKNASYYFVANDTSLNLNKVLIIPLDYQVNKSVYSNIYSSGYFGDIILDVDIILSNKSVFSYSSYHDNGDTSKLINTLYVDNMVVNNINKEEIYNKHFYDETIGHFYPPSLSKFRVLSYNNEATLRVTPNGSVLKTLLNRDKVYSVEFVSFSIWDDIIRPKYNKVYDWYRVLYFPDNETDVKKAYMGYIHSSLLRKSK